MFSLSCTEPFPLFIHSKNSGLVIYLIQQFIEFTTSSDQKNIYFRVVQLYLKKCFLPSDCKQYRVSCKYISICIRGRSEQAKVFWTYAASGSQQQSSPQILLSTHTLITESLSINNWRTGTEVISYAGKDIPFPHRKIIVTFLLIVTTEI